VDKINIINTHSHLDFTGAKDNGEIVVSIGKQNWDKVARYQNFTLGIHPWQIGNHILQDLEILEQKIINLKPIGIGEIGLDYHIDTNRSIQIEFFKSQLNLAQRYNLPVVIHCVKSYDETINILKNYSLKNQIHGFNGSLEQGQKLLDLGCYLSFGLYKKSIKLQNFIQNIPLDKVLIETDEKPSEELINIAQEIADLKQISVNDFVKICNKNTYNLFTKLFKNVK
jgi:TatD DNase family protein